MRVCRTAARRGSLLIFAAAGLYLAAAAAVPTAGASPCIPETMAMSPQPVLSCPDQQPMPFPDTAPLADPAFNPAAPPPGGVAPPVGTAFPAPGQAPYIPPVVNTDGSATSFGQGTGIRDIWNQYTSGELSGILPGAAPAPPP